MRLTLVLAHPDDESFICGGTIAKYAALGADISLVCATKGEMGRRMGNPPFVNRETMPALREAELREACRLLGIGDLRFLGIRDKLVECEPVSQLVETIKTELRFRKPHVVLTFHERIGGHPDHCAIGLATTRACAELKRELPQLRLYFISFGEAMKRPEKYGFRKEQITRIDITDQRRSKMLSFRAHRSQTELDKSLWGPDDRVVREFGTNEYFIQADAPYRPGETDLFAHVK
ncbi:LmbE family protein [Gordoniibacillus kamchatkensis]|uniref:LmbE family protein n=1 Tax=Gordoniibacillus kamchatkensis TaxID=1590651 RepID=A0ABR5AKD9_9BACL|nr:LmbE family protein [Paenibacillus sp. VKM B-2647]